MASLDPLPGVREFDVGAGELRRPITSAQVETAGSADGDIDLGGRRTDVDAKIPDRLVKGNGPVSHLSGHGDVGVGYECGSGYKGVAQRGVGGGRREAAAIGMDVVRHKRCDQGEILLEEPCQERVPLTHPVVASCHVITGVFFGEQAVVGEPVGSGKG